MAALTDAMKWYRLGAGTQPRTKYHFILEIYSSQTAEFARQVYNCVRTVELPKYSIDTQVVNAWNVQQLVPTKVVFEPISFTFNDTVDNRFQKFLKSYLAITTNSFTPITGGLRLGFDLGQPFGIRIQDPVYDVVIEKIVIRRFYGADADRQNFGEESVVTLYRPKIIDVQHDTLDYSASEAVTWQISVRFESMTYEEMGGPPTQPPEIEEQPEQETVEEPVTNETNEIPQTPVEPIVEYTGDMLVKQAGIASGEQLNKRTYTPDIGTDNPVIENIRPGGGSFDGGGASGNF